MFRFDFPIVFIIFSISLFFYSQIFMTISTFSFLYPISITLDHYLSSNVFAQMPDIKKTDKTIMPSLSLFNLIKHGSPYQGNKSAPVVLIDFSDLQCKLCQRFVKSTEPLINSTYIQTGKVILIFKHLPNRGFDSMPASLAAQCTNDQGKFWQFHNVLYNVQGPIDSGWASKDNLKKMALQIPGLDIEKFISCFDSQKYKSLVQSDIELAHSLGFTQTPSFIIEKNNDSNIQKIEGAQPFAAFKAVVDKELGQ
jgi:protein-disulfide isomerase